MDLIGFVARINTASVDKIVQTISDVVVDQWILGNSSLPSSPSKEITDVSESGSGEMSLVRRALITWAFLYLGSLLLYFLFAGIDYYIVFIKFQKKLVPDYVPDYSEMKREILLSCKSLFVMSGMTTPLEVLLQQGYGKIYHNASDYGWIYFFLSPFIFLAVSDCLIYFIHRGLHHPSIYKYIHKLHHSFIHTTPFAAFAFHPFDGYMQGVPYQLFVLVFPFHCMMHLVSLAAVGIWTINIHDRTTWGIPLVNGAAHHNIHHTTFKSNYGQYLICWDWMFGTFKDPKLGFQLESEEEVYGKKNL